MAISRIAPMRRHKALPVPPKEAAGAIVGLPNARIVSGRERCALAQNGAPDCAPAARRGLPDQGLCVRQTASTRRPRRNVRRACGFQAGYRPKANVRARPSLRARSAVRA